MFRISVYIYHCYGGSHSSVTAATLHVGLLSPDQKPTKQVLLSMPYFDTQKSGDHGLLQFVGTDLDNDLVFSVGLETAGEPVIKALRNLVSIANQDIGMVKFIDTMPAVNIWMKIGGVTSRALGLKGIGRPLVTYGTRLAYDKISKLVAGVKEDKGAD